MGKSSESGGAASSGDVMSNWEQVIEHGSSGLVAFLNLWEALGQPCEGRIVAGPPVLTLPSIESPKSLLLLAFNFPLPDKQQVGNPMSACVAGILHFEA